MTRPAILDDPALQEILRALPDARIVGGAVRDVLVGLPVHDIDLATPREPADVMTALRAAGLKTVPTGLAHGTVTAVADHRGFEITTLRRDVTTDGRHAIVAFTDDWQADAARRDFTINAMSMAPDGTLFDYFGGAEDLRASRLRFVGDPAARIAEDYLRILRYFRFWARYATQLPDIATRGALIAGIPELARLSVERVWSELYRMLAAPDPGPAIGLMEELGVLAAILSEGTQPERLSALLAAGAPPDPILRLAALVRGDAAALAALAARLRLSNADRDTLIALRDGESPAPSDDDDTLRRLLADTNVEMLIGRTWLTGTQDPAWSGLRHRLRTLPRPIFALEGRDALTLGVPPGPHVGTLLRQVREWWLRGGCTASPGACRAQLRRLIAPA